MYDTDLHPKPDLHHAFDFSRHQIPIKEFECVMKIRLLEDTVGEFRSIFDYSRWGR
jgi:hypothetical protein